MRCEICGLDAPILTACRAGCARLACATCISGESECDGCVQAEQLAGRRPIRCDDLDDAFIARLLSGGKVGDVRLPVMPREPRCPLSGEPADQCEHLVATEAPDHA